MKIWNASARIITAIVITNLLIVALVGLLIGIGRFDDLQTDFIFMHVMFTVLGIINTLLIFIWFLDYMGVVIAQYLNRGNPDLLLSYDIYKLFFSKNETKARKIDSMRFHRILENFYKNVLEKRYGYHASDRLTAGNTRHYAFCNMRLQGFNMLSIARIGGHKMLRMQLHYHAHLEHFAESAVYILSQNHIKQSKHFSNTLNKEVEIRSKVLDKNDFTHLYEVEHGYCTDHPSRCKVGDCRFCEFYFFSPDNKDQGRRWLRDCSQSLGLRLKEQIQLMIAISKNMEYSLKTLEFPLHKQEHLATSANELRRLMDQKAMVDAELTGEWNHESK